MNVSRETRVFKSSVNIFVYMILGEGLVTANAKLVTRSKCSNTLHTFGVTFRVSVVTRKSMSLIMCWIHKVYLITDL